MRVMPYRFKPRPYQLPALQALDSGIKRVVAVWHRRSGKDLTFVNYTAKAMCERVGTYFYIFPTYAQGKKAIWQGKDRDGFPFIGHFPAELIKAKNETDMRIELVNGSAFQIVGSDKIDALMGTNPIGVVFSEYSLQNPSAWDFIRPILLENGGWAIFDYTPRGKNHGFTLYQMAKDNPDWFAQILTIRDTGVLTEKDMDSERREGVAEEMISQEYYCSFEGVQLGAYYGKELRTAETEGRMVRNLYDPAIGVETWWDIGVGDATSIWFTQSVGPQVHVIDYLEASGESVPYYAKELQAKPYTYLSHNGPHDLEVREWGSGDKGAPVTRREAALRLGINFRIVPQVPLDDGINAARSFLARCWFDKDKCARGLSALESYHKEWDEKAKMFRSYPAHDWSSHAADSLRYLAVGHRITVAKQKRFIEEDSLAWQA